MDMTHRDIDRHDVIPHAGDFEAAPSVSADLKRLERILMAYHHDDDAGGATAQVLFSEIENLRRFVMVPGALRDGLNAYPAGQSAPLGRRLGDTLYAMIERIAGGSLIITKTERLALDRTSRRAFGCLAYLGSIDPSFINRDNAH